MIVLNLACNTSKLYKILDCWSRDINFLGKGPGKVSPPLFVYDFSRKMFLILYSILTDQIPLPNQILYFLVKVASRKILPTGAEAWNSVQIFLDLWWCEFLREIRLKPTRLMASVLFLRNFFSKNLNKLYIIRLEVCNETMVWKRSHFKILSF